MINREALWYHLKTYCRGLANAQTAGAIAKDFNTSARDVNAAKHDLVVNDNRPVAASRSQPHGLYIPASPAEALLYLRQTDAAIFEMQQLRTAFELAAQKISDRQNVLF